MRDVFKKVRFKGQEFWLNSGFLGGLCCNLSPLDHFSESGEMLCNQFNDISYAVVINGKIMRFGEVIGESSELEEADNA